MFNLNPFRTKTPEERLKALDAEIRDCESQSRKFALLAESVDMWAEPMRWGRLRNEVNWYNRILAELKVKRNALKT